MTFAAFVNCIVAMAMFAYKSHSVDASRKVKALLHFMWKAVNQGDKRKLAVASRGSQSSVHSGSLNQFGASVFCDFFLGMWTKEGFPNYTDAIQAQPSSGADVLKRLLGAFQTEGLSDGGGAPDAEAKAEELAAEAAKEGSKAGGQSDGRPRILHGFLLAALFRTRPELSEMVYLELLGRQHDHEIV
jgi:hypothetical protein